MGIVYLNEARKGSPQTCERNHALRGRTMDFGSVFLSAFKKEGPIALALVLVLQFATWLYFEWNPPSLTQTQFIGDLVFNGAIVILSLAIYKTIFGRTQPAKRKSSKRWRA
jgi:hypothetical protein